LLAVRVLAAPERQSITSSARASSIGDFEAEQFRGFQVDHPLEFLSFAR
jgi:hypothetical protein